MTYETIELEVSAKVARLTLNRPGRLNALDPQMLDELLDALATVSTNPGLNVLFLRANGRMFSAGVDLDTPFFMENVEDPSIFSGTRLLNWQHRVIQAIFDAPMVTIAALNGHACGGGGLGLAMACDLRIAVQSAEFWMVPSMLDVVQDFGLSWLAQRQIGPSRALQMALLGTRIPAPRALEWGLLNEVVDDVEALDKRVDALTQTIGAMGTDALRMLKLILRSGEHSELRDQLAIEAVANGLTFQSDEFKNRKAEYFARLRGRK